MQLQFKIYLINASLFIMSIVFTYGHIVCCNELWDGVLSSSFIKDGPVYPMLKETLKLLSLAFGEELLLWPAHRYIWVMSFNLPKQN